MKEGFYSLINLSFAKKSFRQGFAELIFIARSAYKGITQRLNCWVRLVWGYGFGGAAISGVENGREHIQDRGDPDGRLLDDNPEIKLL